MFTLVVWLPLLAFALACPPVAVALPPVALDREELREVDLLAAREDADDCGDAVTVV